ncbi:MAG: hypothetical protein AAF456_05055 [Planctomycetota bacterium]
MNCFTHALPFLDDALMAVAVCIPDWLSAADRKCRARERGATPLLDHEDPDVATIARGVIQHHHDDDWFHRTRAFNEMSLEFAVELRDLQSTRSGMRAGLVGHIIIELFLDAYLHERHPGQLERFYSQVESVDFEKVQQTINLFATRPTERYTWYAGLFKSERYIFDYSRNDGTIYRINKVLQRVGLEELDGDILKWLPGVRERVYNRAHELLESYPPRLLNP